MSRWFRFYDDTLNDPKILRLSDSLYRHWTQILCIASKNGGVLPSIDDVTVMLRFTSFQATRELLDELITRQLLDRVNGETLAPHNWRKRQYKSDVSTERVQQFRKRQRNVSVTSPETDTEQNRTERKIRGAEAPDDENVSQKTSQSETVESLNGLSTKYAFEGGIIRLTENDFAQWTKNYPELDLRGELSARDAWLCAPQSSDRDRQNWFHSTLKYLANRNMEAKAKRKKNQEFVWRSGIEGVV